MRKARLVGVSERTDDALRNDVDSESSPAQSSDCIAASPRSRWCNWLALVLDDDKNASQGCCWCCSDSNGAGTTIHNVERCSKHWHWYLLRHCEFRCSGHNWDTLSRRRLRLSWMAPSQAYSDDSKGNCGARSTRSEHSANEYPWHLCCNRNSTRWSKVCSVGYFEGYVAAAAAAVAAVEAAAVVVAVASLSEASSDLVDEGSADVSAEHFGDCVAVDSMGS